MKFSLRKGHSHIHITCQDEFFSNNIIGDNFEIEYENSVNRVHISIESNSDSMKRIFDKKSYQYTVKIGNYLFAVSSAVTAVKK